MTSKPQPADFFRAHPGLAVFAAMLALGLAALACGQPYNLNDLGSTGANGGAYFVCATGTPVPTVTYVYNERTATPNASGTPQPGLDYDTGLTTPVPTETPYYRQGSFFKDQGAIVSGRFEIYLEGLGGSGQYSTATWRIRNRGADPAALMLSIQTFLANATGRVLASATGAAALGLTPGEELDRRQIPGGGGEDTRTYAYAIPAGSVTDVGLTTGLPGGAGGQSMYFSTSVDPAYAAANACAHGPADWLSINAANAATWNGGAGAPQIVGMSGDGAGLPLPPPAPGKGYASAPGGAVSGGNPIPAPFRIASGFLEGGHHGLDLTPCHLFGCKDYSKVSSSEWVLRMGPGKPIQAAMGGVVHRADCASLEKDAYGCFVIIRTQIGPNDYLYTYYAHMQPWQNADVYRSGVPGDLTCDPSNCAPTTLSVLGLAPAPQFSIGSNVVCGQVLGYVGMTGHTSGPHLHWETRRGPMRQAPYTPYEASQVNPDDTRAYWAQSCGVTSVALEPGQSTLP